jgi:hypothetical protein
VNDEMVIIFPHIHSSKIEKVHKIRLTHFEKMVVTLTGDIKSIREPFSPGYQALYFGILFEEDIVPLSVSADKILVRNVTDFYGLCVARRDIFAVAIYRDLKVCFPLLFSRFSVRNDKLMGAE